MTGAAFTYEPAAVPRDYLNLNRPGAGLIKAFEAVVTRSDGVAVWKSGKGYRSPGVAKQQAGRTAALYRSYFEREGACHYDREEAVKAHAKARTALQRALVQELHKAASQGARAAVDGLDEDEACAAVGYASDTGQGVTWTQAYRLMRDRLSDWTEENPAPEAP